MGRVKRINESGMTLVELVIASAIMATMASTVILARSLMAKQAVNTNDRAFAAQKAIQMYQELRALVNGNENAINLLDNYSNGTQYDYVLTTDKTVDTGTSSANPANALSGNIKTDGNWRYLRQVLVNHISYNADLRQVIVKVWRYASDQNPTEPGQLLAEVDGMLSTNAGLVPPTQVMDVYVLDINNIAAWWDQEWELASDFQQIVASLAGNNIPGSDSANGSTPGLQFRPHYVTRTSYGRDLQYVPYSNLAQSTTVVNSGGNNGPISWVYFYPGNSPMDTVDCAGNTGCAGYFFDPNSGTPGFLGYDGKVKVDGNTYSPTSGSGVASPLFTMADQYNNSMRYPEEVALYQAVTAAVGPGDTLSDPVTEISERMLFDNMLSEPQSFENALIVNLHGELLPLPPLRNYSDAAKDPNSQDIGNNPIAYNGSDANIRVVTHPELLYSPASSAAANSVAVTLRVYAYLDGFDNVATNLDTNYPTSQDPKTDISLFFPDVTKSQFTGDTAAINGVTAIIGASLAATAADGATVKYQYDSFTSVPSSGATGIYAGSVSDGTNPVSFGVTFVGSNNQLLITLYNTRLRCDSGPSTATSGAATADGGLAPADRLYGLEYIPCSPDMTSLTSPLTFTAEDLASTGAPDGSPKNTARWVITMTLPEATTLTGPVTYLGNPYSSGYTLTTGVHTIETRIGANVYMQSNNTSTYVWSSGNPPSDICNLSRTYVWTGFNNPPPTTEQYQFLGDPRDEPYLDTKVGGVEVTGAAATIQTSGYNWWFKDGSSTTGTTPNMYKDGYSGFGAAGNVNGWNTGVDSNFVDLPRFFQVIRQALLNTTSIWTAMNGWTYYYYGFGGEFGSNKDPYPGGVTICSNLYTTTAANGVTAASEMVNWTNAQLYNVHIPANTNNTWYARTWMGELYPDSQVGEWESNGNLPVNLTTNPSNSTFFRQDYANLPTTVSSTISTGNSGQSLNGLGRLQSDRAGAVGCCAFYNGTCQSGDNSYTTSTGQMNHNGGSPTTQTVTLTSLGVTTYNIFTYPLPPSITDDSGNMRPFQLDSTQTSPEWSDLPYDATTMRTALHLAEVSSDTTDRVFYTTNAGTSLIGTGVVQMAVTNSAGTVQYAYVVESGLSIAENIGTNTLGEIGMVLMLRSFLDGGNYSGNAHITQVPLVEMYCDNPTYQYSDPTTINLVVDGAVTTGTSETIDGITIASGPTSNIWFRFPGQTSETANFYTEEYPGYPTLASSTYSESVSVDMNLLYSTNEGSSWLNIEDNSPATFGTLNTNPTYLISTNSFPVTYQWPVPATSAAVTFAQGDYMVAVQAYRHNYPLDYAWHLLGLTIDR